MKLFKLLIVEDNAQDRQTCRDSVARYEAEKQRHFILIESESVEEALSKLDNSFDGAIIDLRLANDPDAGTKVISRIVSSSLRIPIAVFTGTPANAQPSPSYLGVYKKGEKMYAEVLDDFWGIHAAGFTRIMGGRGVIEESLGKVFRNNLLPQREIWTAYGDRDPQRTEKALLRHALNHLLELLDEEVENSFPEEMYITPPIAVTLKTGSIVDRRADAKLFVVLNPACDLVIRANGKFKTDRLLLGEIEDKGRLVDEVRGIQASKNSKERKEAETCQYHNASAKSFMLVIKHHQDSLEQSISKLLRNTYTPYYHWLPQTDFFPGGFLNFRKLVTLTKEEFDEDFNAAKIQIAPSFAKEIVARFASYYGRQGQPDIDCAALISALAEKNQ